MNSYYRAFDQLRTEELTVIRHGWLGCSYEITDGQFVYGKLSYTSWTKRACIIETADTSWKIIPKGIFSRTLFINNANGEIIGDVTPDTWSRRTRVVIINKFEGVFTTKKIISRNYTLTNDANEDIVTIRQNYWSFKTPFKITFDQTLLKQIPELPLLMLTGVQLVLLRQQQAAAAV